MEETGAGTKRVHRVTRGDGPAPLMSAGVAVLAALGTAATAAVAGTLQHVTASRGRSADWTPTGHTAGFIHHQLSQRLWWIALTVQAGSLALHATALRLGSLTVVQPVLATVVVLALPLSHKVYRTKITLAELAWAALVAVSLTAFLLIAAPRTTAAPLQTSHLFVAAIGIGAVVVVLVVLARWAPAQAAAVLLGSASGVAFALEAALLQAVTRPLLRQPLATLGTPIPYALVAAGAAGVLLTQLAYRAGRISSALPAIVTVNPVVSVILGVLSGDSIGGSAGAVAGEVISLGVLMLSVAALARVRPAE